MNNDSDIQARRLQEAALLARRVEGDRLMLADAVLAGALDGSRPLTSGERAALQASPLTQRRLRHLALARRARDATQATPWRGSRGLLRAASTLDMAAPVSDDGWWTLHLLGEQGAWRLVLQLSGGAPFAAGLLAARASVRVRDGAGQVMLEGRLDLDGECEAAWPFADPPALHLQERGALFTVEPC
ncbi:hypothetical protein [Massilia sp. 9096]|uniref:hypothetical protein n=1 Tax=Massilia sp. 9096 TaxID=1500894 RepID=UPI00055D010B|nr:hypothetical protein [Massilia sp. 9096]